MSAVARVADADVEGAEAVAQPAGFWHRYAAWSLDWALLAAPLVSWSVWC